MRLGRRRCCFPLSGRPLTSPLLWSPCIAAAEGSRQAPPSQRPSVRSALTCLACSPGRLVKEQPRLGWAAERGLGGGVPWRCGGLG